jgi:hypothetical protein
MSANEWFGKIVTALRALRPGALPLTVAMLAAALAAPAQPAPPQGQGPGGARKREAHALWAHPPDIGASDEAIRRFIEQCRRANIDSVVLLVKDMDGGVFW